MARISQDVYLVLIRSDLARGQFGTKHECRRTSGKVQAVNTELIREKGCPWYVAGTKARELEVHWLMAVPGHRSSVGSTVADQVGGDLVAGDQQETQQVQHLALAQALAAVFGMGQQADDVVAERAPALRDHRPEIRVEVLRCVPGGRAFAEAHRRLQQAGALLRLELEAVPVLCRDAQHLGDHDDRQRLGEGRHEVEAVGIVDGVQECSRGRADADFQGVDRRGQRMPPRPASRMRTF